MKCYNNTFRILSFPKLFVITLVLFFYLSGCQNSGQSVKSRSIGAPGELLVVMDKQIQKSEIKKIINEFAREEFPCIPQPEPTFRLTTITPKDFEGHFRAYRNIIIVQEKASVPANISFQKDVWAGYQQVVEISVPNKASFSDIFRKNQIQIFDYLYYGDIKTMQKANLKGADAATQRFINERFGVNMVLPKGFRLVKDTTNLSWFRYDKLETSIHVVLYSFDMDSIADINNKNLIQLRDYIGEVYIPGPSELTFMQTEKKLPVLSNRLKVNGIDVIELRGLWKVEGFFMGGPFVNYSIPDTKNNRLLMIDSFVYAPEKQNKAYYVRQMESILHSVKNI